MFHSPFKISMGISFNKSGNWVGSMVMGMSIGRFMVDRGMVYWAMVQMEFLVNWGMPMVGWGMVHWGMVDWGMVKWGCMVQWGCMVDRRMV